MRNGEPSQNDDFTIPKIKKRIIKQNGSNKKKCNLFPLFLIKEICVKSCSLQIESKLMLIITPERMTGKADRNFFPGQRSNRKKSFTFRKRRIFNLNVFQKQISLKP
jgi:hypothetical protein